MSKEKTEWKEDELPKTDPPEDPLTTEQLLQKISNQLATITQILRSDKGVPELTIQATLMDKVTNGIPENLRKDLTFEDTQSGVVVRPRRYLGKQDFSTIARAITSLGGEYVSSGKNSHWVVPE